MELLFLLYHLFSTCKALTTVKKANKIRKIGEVTSIMKKNKPGLVRRISKIAWISVITLVFATLLGILLIAEPWVSDPTEHTIAPETTDMGRIELSLGEEYIFDIPLGANEVLSAIDSSQPLVIEPIGYGVRAHGAMTEVSVTVTTREAVMSGHSKRIVFFGQDYSEPYYNLRRALRSFMGIKNAYTLPSELRVLHIYQYRFIVPEYPTYEAQPITLRAGEYTDLALEGMVDNVYTIPRVLDTSLADLKQLVTDNDYRLIAKKAGKTEIVVMYGFYSSTATQPKQFVPVQAQRYPVTITK